MSEWPKEHAWKVCIRKRIEGSNPSLSANKQTADKAVFLWVDREGENPRGFDKIAWSNFERASARPQG